MFAKQLENIPILGLEARFCRYALPILPADLNLLSQSKGFWIRPGIEPFVQDPLGFEKDRVKVSAGPVRA